MRANLLRAISHDLRTPLTSIIGSSTSYLENEDRLEASEKRSLVEHIYEDSTWLLHMVENLLSITRIHQDTKARVTRSLEPFEEVLSEAVLRLKKRAPDAQIEVHFPSEFVMIPMDAMLIEQVIINLLENALVHSESIQPIDCFVTTDKTSLTFHVGIMEKALILPDCLAFLTVCRNPRAARQTAIKEPVSVLPSAKPLFSPWRNHRSQKS